jgi:C1A family cysteine protease
VVVLCVCLSVCLSVCQCQYLCLCLCFVLFGYCACACIPLSEWRFNADSISHVNNRYLMKNEPCNTAKEKNVVAKITSFTDVPKNNEAQLIAAIATGPVSVAVEADQVGWQHYASGIFSGPCGTQLDHGVLAVGYTDKYFIVKNSWGTTWGDEG